MRKQQAKTRVAVRQCMTDGCVSVHEHGTNISRHEVLLCSPPTAKQAWRLHRIASHRIGLSLSFFLMMMI
jgi:hypothetical protein